MTATGSKFFLGNAIAQVRTGGKPRARSVNDVKTGDSRFYRKRQIQILINKVNFLISFTFCQHLPALRFFSAVPSSEAITCGYDFQRRIFSNRYLKLKTMFANKQPSSAKSL